jgi:hypothetical protein
MLLSSWFYRSLVLAKRPKFDLPLLYANPLLASARSGSLLSLPAPQSSTEAGLLLSVPYSYIFLARPLAVFYPPASTPGTKKIGPKRQIKLSFPIWDRAGMYVLDTQTYHHGPRTLPAQGKRELP